MKGLLTFSMGMMVLVTLWGQTIRYVKTTGLQGGGYQGPYSWNDNEAYRDLQAAINDSQFGDEVWVAQGTYIPIYDSAFVYTDSSRWSTFVLKEGVKVRGSFQGLPGQEGDTSYQDLNMHPSILSADIKQNDPSYFPWPGGAQISDSYIIDNAYSIVRNVTPLTSATLLDNFVIKHAYYLDTTLPNYGNQKVIGAVFLKENASPILSNLLFMQNNGAVGWIPGFIHFPGQQSIAGSAITIVNSSPTIKNCMFWRNYSGPAITVNNFVNYDTVYVKDSYFIDNYGGDAGAVICPYGAAKLVMINCMMYYNFSNYGTGLIAKGFWTSNPVEVIIQNCTYMQNNLTSLAYPGRLFYLMANYGHAAVDVKVANSVFWDNGPKFTSNNTPDGIFYYDSGISLDITNSLVEFGWPHYKSNILTSNPLFVSLPSTNLSPLDFDYKSAFNVYENSPLIDPNLPQVYFNVPFDINGNPRDANPDLSSFEFEDPIPASLIPIENSEHVIIYPNPFSNEFSIKLDHVNNAILQIYDITGREIHQQLLENNINQISVKGMLSGLYTIKVSTTNGDILSVRKIIKQ
ncbi:MAG: T9SS type A sorting domain-containing protein [Bacteroidales bacterium]|nr:T9SS type A sorting domain-containing protein [Bacteroidales bacterium]